MPVRPFVLPDDTRVLLDVIPPAFTYPENPEWSVQTDEMEGMTDTMRTLRRMWPLLRVVGVFTPAMRDMMRGFVWEEDGQPVGLVNVIRRGSSDSWLIGNVAVLPEYRRRGIARSLVEACLDLAKERGARQIVLDVVAGNVPAYALYERLGFVHYTGSVEYDYEWQPAPPAEADCPLPKGYTLEPTSLFNWQARYDLARRITPPAVQEHEPIEEGAFRQPRILYPLAPALMKMMGVRQRPYVVRDPGGQIVAAASYGARTRSGGTNSVSLHADPAHPAVARPVLAFLLRQVAAESSDQQRVTFDTPQWQQPVIEAAAALGFRDLFAFHRMGMAVT